jgi:hypothetical protein
MLVLFPVAKNHEGWKNESLLECDFFHVVKRSW